MYQFNPKCHYPKDKESLKTADVWPFDLVISGQDKWIMSPDLVGVPLKKYLKDHKVGK